MLAPVMEKVSEEFSGKAEFIKTDIDKNMELAARYGIMSIPLVAVFKNGEMTAKTLGFSTQSEMREFLEGSL